MQKVCHKNHQLDPLQCNDQLHCTTCQTHFYILYLAEDDCDQALELNKKLKSELNSFDPCPVMDYVKQTAKTQDIKRTVTEMHRKVDINQLMKKTYIKQLRGLNSGYLHQ